MFTPFQQELRASTERKGRRIKLEDLDTIVVPAREDGFSEVFLGEDCAYKIPMSSSMIERVKYIAAYQSAPVSAITHYAEVKGIEKYRDTHKYIVACHGLTRPFTPRGRTPPMGGLREGA